MAVESFVINVGFEALEQRGLGPFAHRIEALAPGVSLNGTVSDPKVELVYSGVITADTSLDLSALPDGSNWTGKKIIGAIFYVTPESGGSAIINPGPPANVYASFAEELVVKPGGFVCKFESFAGAAVSAGSRIIRIEDTGFAFEMHLVLVGGIDFGGTP